MFDILKRIYKKSRKKSPSPITVKNYNPTYEQTDQLSFLINKPCPIDCEEIENDKNDTRDIYEAKGVNEINDTLDTEESATSKLYNELSNQVTNVISEYQQSQNIHHSKVSDSKRTRKLQTIFEENSIADSSCDDVYYASTCIIIENYLDELHYASIFIKEFKKWEINLNMSMIKKIV